LHHLEDYLEEVMGAMGLGLVPKQQGSVREWEQEEAWDDVSEPWDADEASWAENDSEMPNGSGESQGGVTAVGSVVDVPLGEAFKCTLIDASLSASRPGPAAAGTGRSWDPELSIAELESWEATK
jgi:hypothetical protein